MFPSQGNSFMDCSRNSKVQTIGILISFVQVTSKLLFGMIYHYGCHRIFAYWQKFGQVQRNDSFLCFHTLEKKKMVLKGKFLVDQTSVQVTAWKCFLSMHPQLLCRSSWAVLHFLSLFHLRQTMLSCKWQLVVWLNNLPSDSWRRERASIWAVIKRNLDSSDTPTTENPISCDYEWTTCHSNKFSLSMSGSLKSTLLANFSADFSTNQQNINY